MALGFHWSHIKIIPTSSFIKFVRARTGRQALLPGRPPRSTAAETHRGQVNGPISCARLRGFAHTKPLAPGLTAQECVGGFVCTGRCLECFMAEHDGPLCESPVLSLA